MLFRFFSNANLEFRNKKLTWGMYTIAEAIPTSKQVKLIDKYEFVKAALDENSETFVVHIVALKVPAVMTIHLS